MNKPTNDEARHYRELRRAVFAGGVIGFIVSIVCDSASLDEIMSAVIAFIAIVSASWLLLSALNQNRARKEKK